MKSIQSVPKFNFSSPTLNKEEKLQIFKPDQSDLCLEYKKRVKILQSTLKHLNFPEISYTNRNPNRPIMTLERVKILANNCGVTSKMTKDGNNKQRRDTILPVISSKKVIHKAIKKIRSGRLALDEDADSPEKLISCRYKSEIFTQSKEFYELRSSVPLINENRWNGQISPKGGTVFKQSPSLLVCPLSPKLQKDTQDDEFYYKNISNNSLFTSFAALLECQFETYPNPFPYCGKVLKNVGRRGSYAKKALMTPAKLKEIPANSISVEKEGTSSCESKFQVPGVLRIFFHPRNVICPKKILILNLASSDQLENKTWELIKDVSEIFQVIFVIHKDFEQLLEAIETLNIMTSGLYLLSDLSVYPKEIAKLQDYSQIFQDFKCKHLQKNVLIVSYHLLAEVEEIGKFLIKPGTSPKIAALRIPVSISAQEEMPFTFLLPHPSQSLDSLEFLLSYLSSVAKIDFSSHFVNEAFLILEQNLHSLLSYHFKLGSLQDSPNTTVIIFNHKTAI